MNDAPFIEATALRNAASAETASDWIVHETARVQDRVASTSLTYRILRGVAIAEIVAAWKRLLAGSSCNRAFASPEWCLGSFRTAKYAGHEHCVVAAFREDELVGVLPSATESGQRIAEVPSYCSDYCDLIARDDDVETAAGLLTYAITNEFEHLRISMVASDSNCARAVPVIAADPSIECIYRLTEVYRCIDLPDEFDEYLASKSRNFRKGVKRTQRNAAEAGFVMRELTPDQFEPARLPELCLSMISARQGQEYVMRAETIRLFVSEVFPALFAQGSIRVFAMLKEERIVALDICMVSAKGLATWNGGFVVEAEQYSPGTLLFGFEIEQAIRERRSEYDFLKGDEDYKRRWANSSRAVCELTLTRR